MSRSMLLSGVVLVISLVAAVAAEPTPANSPSKSLLNWIDVCVLQLGSADPVVRESASTAIRAIGEAARPALEQTAAKGGELAGQLIERMNRLAAAPRAPAGAADTKTSAPTGMPDRLALKLGLDEQQTARVEAAFSAYAEAQRDLVDQARTGKIDRARAAEKLEGLRVGFDAMLAEILTDEQQANYEKLFK